MLCELQDGTMGCMIALVKVDFIPLQKMSVVFLKIKRISIELHVLYNVICEVKNLSRTEMVDDLPKIAKSLSTVDSKRMGGGEN